MAKDAVEPAMQFSRVRQKSRALPYTFTTGRPQPKPALVEISERRHWQELLEILIATRELHEFDSAAQAPGRRTPWVLDKVRASLQLLHTGAHE